MSHFFTDTKLNWLESILYERFGHKLLLNQQGKHLRMVLQGSDKEIIFDQLQGVFHQSCSNFSCYEWDAFSQGYQTPISNLLPAPSVSPLPERLIEYHPEGASIHYDILGLTFWMLTRLEEVGSGELDKHQRFPATASHAYKHNYLERPVVDEWLIILGQVIQRVWQGVSLKRNQYCVKVSHDVDIPSLYGFKPWPKIARMMAGHLLKRCDMKSFFKAPYVKIATVNRLHSADPYNTFDWLMDISDSYNLKSAFYFICGGNHQFDADYQPEHPAIRNLMRHIHGRGHEVGLHPSYDSFKEPEVIKQQADRLKQICIEEGIKQTEWGGRMHYLRWKQPTTMRLWAEAGMHYDTTLGYADRPGFRTGTCHEYPAFDPVTQESLNLRIRPLVVMECTIIAERYMALGVGKAAEERISILKERCASVQGCFSLLWHNSFFESPACFEFYIRAVKP